MPLRIHMFKGRKILAEKRRSPKPRNDGCKSIFFFKFQSMDMLIVNTCCGKPVLKAREPCPTLHFRKPSAAICLLAVITLEGFLFISLPFTLVYFLYQGPWWKTKSKPIILEWSNHQTNGPIVSHHCRPLPTLAIILTTSRCPFKTTLPTCYLIRSTQHMLAGHVRQQGAILEINRKFC